MKYGNYNTLYLVAEMTSSILGTVTQETVNKIKAAKAGLAHITFKAGNEKTENFPAMFCVGLDSNNAEFAHFAGIKSNGDTVSADIYFDTLRVEIKTA